MPKASEKKVAYNLDYNKHAYDRVNLFIPQGRLAELRAFAKEHGESVNSLANRLFQAELGYTDEQWKAKSENPSDSKEKD